MTAKALAIARLVRLPNLFTAAADILAGATIAGAASRDRAGLAVLAAASVCLYAFGTVLNDVCDANRDSKQRPNRPIPAGQVTRSSALALAIVLAVAGIALAALTNPTSAWNATAIAAAVIAYNVIFKNTPLAPPLMGICRGLNLLLGASITAPSAFAISTSTGTAAALYALYVASLTLFARDEAADPNPRRLRQASIGMLTATAGAAIWLGARSLPSAVMPLLHLIAIWRWCNPCWRNPDPAQVQRTVGRLVLGNVWFVAGYALAFGGALHALAVLALLVPARLVARRIHVT